MFRLMVLGIVVLTFTGSTTMLTRPEQLLMKLADVIERDFAEQAKRDDTTTAPRPPLPRTPTRP